MVKHTPGPWRYFPLQSKNWWAGFQVVASDPEAPRDERDIATCPNDNEANVRMIVAAPAMANELLRIRGLLLTLNFDTGPIDRVLELAGVQL